jgi:acetyl esterase/lipase
MEKLILSLLICCFLTSCEEFRALEPFQRKATLGDALRTDYKLIYETRYNQNYGEDPYQKYDLYLPKRDSSFAEKPTISLIMVHGGGWSLLDKSYLNSVVYEFTKKGLNLAVFNINHRLADHNDTNFAEIMDDFSLFFEHHDSLKTNLGLSDRVVLWGYSSGGHLALSYAYKFRRREIDAVIAMAAPTDLTDKAIHQGIFDDKNRNLTELLIGQSYQANPEAYKEASPYFMVHKKNPTTLLFYGGNDILVDKAQGEKLNKALRKKNIQSEFRLVYEATHDFDNKMGQITDDILSLLEDLK